MTVTVEIPDCGHAPSAIHMCASDDPKNSLRSASAMDSVLRGLRVPETEIPERTRRELAIAFYAQGALSLGKAAELAQTARSSFGEILAERGIPRHYTSQELAEDLRYARGE